MRLKNLMLGLMFLLPVFFAQAQDFSLSTFYHSPLNLSAAFTGDFEGSYRINAFNRNQWRSVTQPFRSFGLGVDGHVLPKFDNLGAGIQLNVDEAGDGFFTETQLQIPLAYAFSLSSIQKLSLGLAPAVWFSSIDPTRLQFASQYSALGFNGSLPSGETGLVENAFGVAMSAGVATSFTWSKYKRLSVFANANNVIQPAQSLLFSSRIQTRISTGVSAVLPVGSLLFAEPNALFQWQGPNNIQVAGANIGYVMREKRYDYLALLAGVHYRISGAPIVSIGANFTRLTIRASYDIELGDVRPLSSGRGGGEVSILFVFDNPPPQRIHFQQCPVFL